MKKLILTFIYSITLAILLSYSLSAQVLRYVNKNATGGVYNGLSWATGWRTFADINWGALTPGSTLYISGGVDSIVYNEELTPQCRGTKNSLIHIFAGRNSPSPSGHSGRVIIDRQSVDGSNAIFINEYAGRSPAYLHIKGFELQWMSFGIHVDDDMSRSGGLNARGIIFDSLKITKFLGTPEVIPAVGVWGESDSMIVQNCYIKTMNTPGQTDCFHYNAGYHNGTTQPRFNIIRNNFIDNTNQDPVAHNDAIQGVDGEGYWIYNNIIINDSVYSQQGGGVPFIVTSNDWENDNWPPNIWFNNFAYMGGAWWPGASPGYVMWNRHDGGAGDNKSAGSFIFNNTLVSNGANMGIFENQYQYDLFVNNIGAQFCLVAYRGEWRTPFSILNNLDGGNEELDSTRYNLYWRQDSVTTPIWGYNEDSGFLLANQTLVKPVSWANWTSYSGNSLFRNPKFVNHFGYEPDQSVLTPDIQANSPAINAGEDLTWLRNYFTSIGIPSDIVDAMGKDIYGNPRNDWDIGAVEYGVGAADTVPSFSFTPVTGAELNTEYIGKARFPSTSVDSTFHVWTTTSASFKINYNGTYSTAMKEAEPDDTVYVKNQSDDTRYLFTTTETIYAGNVVTGQNFNVTTKADPGGGGVVNGGWISGSNGRKIYLRNGHALITRQP